jgi:hypothetical protein
MNWLGSTLSEVTVPNFRNRGSCVFSTVPFHLIHPFRIGRLLAPLPLYEDIHTVAMFVWLISHQPALLYSQNKPAISNQPAVLFSQNKPAPAISHQPNEQADRCWECFLYIY